VRVGFKETLFEGRYKDFATGETVVLERGATLDLPAWGYRVYTR
jgi:hypothetical protein